MERMEAWSVAGVCSLNEYITHIKNNILFLTTKTNTTNLVITIKE